MLLPLYCVSSHIIGGEIYYDCLNNNNYRITLKVFRDCYSTGAQYDNPLKLSIFDGNGTLLRVENFDFPGSEMLPVEFNNPCVNPPDNICVEIALYSKIINLPPKNGGYTLSYQRCCRGSTVINLIDPEVTGLTLVAHIPGSETGISCNNSPRFSNYPPLALCNEFEFEFDHSATDPDGDSLSYELCSPFEGATETDPAPNSSEPPPYLEVNWSTNFSQNEPLGNGSETNLDNLSGMFTTKPQYVGKYAVGVKVKEWRNGILIGETIRDFLFLVVNCNVNVVSSITPQSELSTNFNKCGNLNITFENTSINGKNYKWDFGVDGIESDTSNLFEPTFLFPEAGTYEVSLIVNPGWTKCTDTTVVEFNFYDSIILQFSPPKPQCITDNSFDFFVNSENYTNLDWTWTFGNNGEYGTSNLQNPQEINFSSTGYIPIVITSKFQDICETTISDSIYIFSEPFVKFYFNSNLKCSRIPIFFIDSSWSETPISYLWDFDDNNQTSNLQNPNYLYQNTGIYYPTLTIQTDSGCIRKLTSPPKKIIVYPSPISEFSLSPYEVSVFKPHINFQDFSVGADSIIYFFGDGEISNERKISHTYKISGKIKPIQIVFNEFGCSDTSTKEIYIKEITTIYVPNTFTPDEDGFNDYWKPIVRDVIDYELFVYNRYGEEIIKTQDINFKWNGKYKGIPSPDGVYLYHIYFKQYNDKVGNYISGHFSILR